MPCSGPFHFSYSVAYMTLFLSPDPDVGLSIIVCAVEHTSFHFGLCGCKFVCQADGKVAICCPAGHESSLYLFLYLCP